MGRRRRRRLIVAHRGDHQIHSAVAPRRDKRQKISKVRRIQSGEYGAEETEGVRTMVENCTQIEIGWQEFSPPTCGPVSAGNLAFVSCSCAILTKLKVVAPARSALRDRSTPSTFYCNFQPVVQRHILKRR